MFAAYPCLKGHGPIEAPTIVPVVCESAAYPCLKGHGPIEADTTMARPARQQGYPCLKGHGPIEAWYAVSEQRIIICDIHA